nr:cytochrome b [Sphingomonas rhizophila]
MIERLRAWAESYTKRGRYSPVGFLFHWVMAALVLFQLGWGFWADWVMPGGDKQFAYQVHSAAGLPVLLLAIARIFWRMLVPSPFNDADRQGLQTKIAHTTAILFYISFFSLPLSGWVMWSSVASGPLYVAGVMPWPQLPLGDLAPMSRFALLDLAEDIHVASVILLLVLVPAHVGAALKHHFWDRHDVLRGMLPEVADWTDTRKGGGIGCQRPSLGRSQKLADPKHRLAGVAAPLAQPPQPQLLGEVGRGLPDKGRVAGADALAPVAVAGRACGQAPAGSPR